MANCGVTGNSNLVFIIGGSLGLSVEVLKRANYKLCFSKMTFPHQLFRVMLLEQVYRGFRIINGEPYHKWHPKSMIWLEELTQSASKWGSYYFCIIRNRLLYSEWKDGIKEESYQRLKHGKNLSGREKLKSVCKLKINLSNLTDGSRDSR